MIAKRATTLVGAELGIADRRFAVMEETDDGPVTCVAASRVRPEGVIAWLRRPSGELITALGGRGRAAGGPWDDGSDELSRGGGNEA